VLCFGELANAFRTLHSFSDDWTDDAVISVIDEMICERRISLIASVTWQSVCGGELMGTRTQRTSEV